MKYAVLLISLLLAGPLLAGQQLSSETYVSLSSLSYSDIAPIRQVINGLEGKPIDSGDHAFTHNQLEIGQVWRNWEFAAFWRYDYFLEFDQDTAQLVYLDKNKVPLQSGRNYRVDLKANHLLSQGLGLGYRYQLSPAIKLRGRFNYLVASQMQDGTLRGNLATEAGSYNADVWLDYGYSEDLLLGRARESMQGRGWSLDLDLDWIVTQQLRVYLQGRDLYSAIRWDNLSYTLAEGSTDRASFEPDGSISFRPAIRGQEFYRDHTQRLPRRMLLGTQYLLSNQWSLEGELFAYDEYLFPRAALNWHLGYATLQASYDVGAQAYGVGLNSRYLHFLLRSDSHDYTKARALQLELLGRLVF